MYDPLVLLCTLYVAKTGGRESPLTFLIVGEDVQTFEGTCGATGTYVMYHVYFPKINLVRLEISKVLPWTLFIRLNQTFRLNWHPKKDIDLDSRSSASKQ